MLSLLLTIFWFVQFTDKLGSAPIPFSERATENRKIWNIPTDSLDYAVVPAYLDSVRTKGAHVCHISRWMNGCTIAADSASASAIKQLPFVLSIEQTRNETPPSSVSPRKLGRTQSNDIYASNAPQLDFYNLRPLHRLGYEGQGLRIAVIDIGFYNVNTAPCFDSVRNRNGIVGIYDFSADTTPVDGAQGAHGSNCLSYIAAQTSTYHGAATAAEFILIRTEEYATESPKECDNLVAAYELCDSLGVNIITCSLGYRLFDDPTFNLTYAMLDGRTTRVSRAATIAARKGMLLFQSAGNDGTNQPWSRISVPADADSIITVGAAKLDTTMASFSSYGPSTDGRIKPDVSAVGYQAVYWNTGTNQSAAGNGTSFSTPLTAGLAACLWSALPHESAWQIRQRIIESAHLYPSFDSTNQMGYGIPDAYKAYQATPTSLPTIHYPLSTTHYPLPTTHYPLPTTPYPLPATPCTKLIRNGQFLILRDGKVYNAQGTKL